MQIQDTPDSGKPTKKRKPLTGGMVVLLLAAFCIVLFLRHDWWNWTKVEPLLFGIIPIGLWWQVMVSFLACGMLWLFVKFAWPDHLEDGWGEDAKK